MRGVTQCGGATIPLAPAELRQASIRKHICESAVSSEHLTEASSAVLSSTVPVHCELANDAAENELRSNYRSAIIFAAAAIEACAGNVIDREYGNKLKQAPLAAHRRVTITVNRRETIVKDPIYEALRCSSGEGGSQFLALLHEIPLYLLERSLMLDKQQTYQLAHSVYRTRNCLAHTGTTDDRKGGLLDVSEDGALTSLQVMNDVFDWFGERGTTIPRSGFIALNLQIND
jgi:hypothetical protein